MSDLRIKVKRVSLIIALIAIVVFVVSAIQSLRQPFHVSHSTYYTIDSHESMKTVSQDLFLRGDIANPSWMVYLSELTGTANHLKSGQYVLTNQMSFQTFFSHITHHHVQYYPVTIVDGWTVQTLLAVLNETPYLTHDVNTTNPELLMRELTGKTQPAEGWFLPQTYFVAQGGSEMALLKRAHRAMQSELAQLWSERADHLPIIDPYQALVMASLIEEEANQQADMPLIANVFYNRLKAGMPLQSDPTVLYAVHKPYGSHLTHADLKSHELFNTYRYVGLPAHPIGLPSISAIYAALHPTHKPYYYFESSPHGRSIFSKTLAAHRQAIKQRARS